MRRSNTFGMKKSFVSDGSETEMKEGGSKDGEEDEEGEAEAEG